MHGNEFLASVLTLILRKQLLVERHLRRAGSSRLEATISCRDGAAGVKGARKSAYGRLDTLLSEQCPAWRFDSLNPALSSGSWTRIIYALSGSRPERHGLCPRQRSWELTEPNWSKPTWTTSAYVWPFCLECAKAGTAAFGCRKLQPGLVTHAGFTVFEYPDRS
jgi:hypothetical protein